MSVVTNMSLAVARALPRRPLPSVQSIRILSEHLTPPNKLLGIDFGMRYLGVSLSDGSNLVAAPFRTFDEKSASKAFGFGPDSLSSIIDAHRVQALVVGVPFTSGGGEDEACARVRRFVAELHANRVTDRPIFLWDEAGTSAEAKRVLHDVYGVVSLGDQKRRGSDRMAACMILQRFLDHFNTARTARARAFSPKLNANTPDFALHMAMAMQMQASGRRSDGAQALLDRLPRDDPYVILPAREARQ